jgi:hypothetical protein
MDLLDAVDRAKRNRISRRDVAHLPRGRVRLNSPDSRRTSPRCSRRAPFPITAFTGSFDKKGNPKPSFTKDVLSAHRSPRHQAISSTRASSRTSTASTSGSIAARCARTGGFDSTCISCASARTRTTSSAPCRTLLERGRRARRLQRAAGRVAEEAGGQALVREIHRPQLVQAGEGQDVARGRRGPDRVSHLRALQATTPTSSEVSRGHLAPDRRGSACAEARHLHRLPRHRAGILKRGKPDIKRKHTKITNFCKLFGAAEIKFAFTLELISQQQFGRTLRTSTRPGKWRVRMGERQARFEPSRACRRP